MPFLRTCYLDNGGLGSRGRQWHVQSRNLLTGCACVAAIVGGLGLRDGENTCAIVESWERLGGQEGGGDCETGGVGEGRGIT